jgi:hypothetical protein
MKGLQATERGFSRKLNNEDLEVWFQKTINMTEIKRNMCQWVGQNERHVYLFVECNRQNASHHVAFHPGL